MKTETVHSSKGEVKQNEKYIPCATLFIEWEMPILIPLKMSPLYYHY